VDENANARKREGANKVSEEKKKRDSASKNTEEKRRRRTRTN
jgi:hypothetical protein